MNLPSLQTDKGMYCVVELNIVPQLASAMGLDLSLTDTSEKLQQLVQKLAQVVSRDSSAIVVDPVFGFPALQTLERNAGILTLHQSVDSVDPLVLPKLIPNWGIENIKSNYCVAELELYYHPKEKLALQKKQLVMELSEYARQEGIALLLKLIIYTPADEEFEQVKFQEAQLTAVEELRKGADLLALQYPGDALSAATLTAALDLPWVVTAEGVSYEDFKDILRTAVNNGARGFSINDAWWYDLTQLRLEDQSPDWEAINYYIETHLRDRIIELRRITNELGEAYQQDVLSTTSPVSSSVA